MTVQQTYNPAGVDLAVAALAQIEMHPETWKQAVYRCETGMCIAGWMGELSPDVRWRTESDNEDFVTLPSGIDCHVSTWAAEFLGMSEREADNSLFDESNSIEDLRAGVKALCNGESVLDAIERDRAERAK